MLLLILLSATFFGNTLGDFNEAELRKQIINYYNFLRSLHDAPPLVTDPALDASAAAWARHLSVYDNSQACLYHSRLGGENIYFGWSTKWTTQHASEGELARNAMKAFYDVSPHCHIRSTMIKPVIKYNKLQEIRLYDYNRPGLYIPAAHFTNLVWKSCQKIGIGIYHMTYRSRHGACNVQAGPSYPARGYMIVIHQYPAGNVIGAKHFRENVLPPKRVYRF